MRYKAIVFISLLLLTLQSCRTKLNDYATEWSIDVKQKIIEDSNQEPDSINFDTANYDVTLYKANLKLKSFHLKPILNNDGNNLSFDTVNSTFYSADQDFELIRELCPVNDRSFEGIRYKGQHLGLTEIRYCDGQLKKIGFRMNGDVGVWMEYDIKGKLVDEIDHGNIGRLEKLKEIKYYR